MDQTDIAGIARHLLTTAGGALVADGLITSGQLQDAIGALITIAGIAWSLWQKHKQRAVVAALKAPAPSPIPPLPTGGASLTETKS